MTVARPQDGDWTRALLRAMTPRTRLASLCPCHWTDGGLIDLVAIRRELDAHDGLLLVDATQSLGAMPLDIKQVRPDFLVAATYKWLLGPNSLGFLYVAAHWQDGQPLEENWVNREAAHDFGTNRGLAIRITPHVYNNQEDVAPLLEVLQAARRTR